MDEKKEDYNDVNFSDFIRIIRIRRRIIVSVFFLVLACTVFYLMVITPRYTATAVVMLDQRKNNVEDTAAVLSGLPTDTSAVQNQLQILTSKELISRVIDKAHLLNDPEFNGRRSLISTLMGAINPVNWFGASKVAVEAAGEDVRRNAIIHAILGRLHVSPLGISTAINIQFESVNPEKAAFITNAVATAYIEDQLEAKFEATRRATDWLSGRISDLSKQTQAAEAAVQSFKAEHNITTDSKGGTVVDQQISDLNNRLIIAKTDLAEKQANYGRLAALASSGNAANAPQVVSSPLISTLRAQESELTRKMADLSSKYGARHPKILDLQAQKANLDSKINDEINRIVLSVKSDAQAAQDRVNSLQGSLHQLELQNAGENKDSVRLKALQAEADSSRAMYQAFLGKLNQTQNQQGIQTPDARIITKAEVPGAPSFPNRKIFLLVAAVLGLGLGFMLALLAEKLDSGFRTSEQVTRLLHLPVLATIPEIGGDHRLSEPFPGTFLNRIWKKLAKKYLQAHDPVSTIDMTRHGLDKPMSSYAEALRGLQLGVTLSDVDLPPRTMMLTSSASGEGKSTLALSLARAMAQNGKHVVLVDCDLRRPTQLKLFGASSCNAGISEALAEKGPLEDYLIADELTSVRLFPCVKPAANPMQILSSQAFQNLIRELQDKFDFVILDSSPVLPVNDSRILATYVNTVLFVLRWEETPREAAAQAIQLLREAHATLAGVAITRTDDKQFHYYNYGYKSYRNYSHYSRYYTE